MEKDCVKDSYIFESAIGFFICDCVFAGKVADSWQIWFCDTKGERTRLRDCDHHHHQDEDIPLTTSFTLLGSANTSMIYSGGLRWSMVDRFSSICRQS